MIFLIVLLVALAAACLVYALSVIFGRRQTRLERQLAGYEKPDFPDRPQSSAADVLRADTAVVQSAMDFTSRLAERSGLLVKTEKLLEQADVPLRPAEILFWVPVLSIVLFVVVTLLLGPLTGLIVAAAAVILPIAYLQYKRRQRLQLFERQLPETLNLLAGAMRAGFSFMQALEAVAEETADPMRRELKKVFAEARLGRSVEEALGEVAERMDSQDLSWSVMAIQIQREVGGNLAELLDTVADTMVQRERLRRDIRSLTAEGRLSGIVLSLVPPILALFIYTMEPDFIQTLFDETIGVIAIIGAVVLNIIGWIWIQKIVDIEV
jgi:tight adherence protein B